MTSHVLLNVNILEAFWGTYLTLAVVEPQRNMSKKLDASKQFVSRMSGSLPQFTDIFDEETFLIAFFVVAAISIAGAFIASRYITLKDAGHRD